MESMLPISTLFNVSPYTKKVQAIQSALQLASTRSYWCMTPQEIRLFGGIFDERFVHYSHMPLLLAGSTSSPLKSQLENLRKERKKIGMSLAFSYLFFDVTKYNFESMPFVLCTLEPLDANGNTVQDPVAIDEAGIPVSEAVISEKLPFRRQK